MVAFLGIATVSAYYYKNYILGFGPHESASLHGDSIDSMMKWTLGVTYVAFFITNAVLFSYAYRYRARKGHKARYISHNNTVELVWTGIPAIVMTFLVVGGLDAWNDIMADVGADDNYMEVEATGYQFAWQMRYPGPDGLLGRKDFRLISGANPLGQDWTDPKNHDDILVNDVTLPVDQKVRVRITAKDVLHDFYLPQFRVKMDAVPGLPTYFVFTPTKTTKEWRRGLSEYPEYQEIDEASEEGLERWQTANFELACAELCGKGHWSMARTVTILEQDAFDTWYAGQTSFYEANIKGTEDDPLFMAELEERRETFTSAADNALRTPDDEDNLLTLDFVDFEEGTARLTDDSKYQLADVAGYMEDHQSVTATVLDYPATVDGVAVDYTLSEDRARAVRDFFIELGISSERLEYSGQTPDSIGEDSRNPGTLFYIKESRLEEPDPADATL
jgi:cytochrome c oxidase subunit 2